MPISKEHLAHHARIMGERSRRTRVTRPQAREYILGYLRAWTIAHREAHTPDDALITHAIRAYAAGRGCRFSAEARPMLPLRYRPIRNAAVTNAAIAS